MARHGRSRYAPDTLPRPAHWSKDAACRDAPPDLFHPEGDSGLVLLDTAEAKSWCARCAVREECLADALARGEPYGVFGGMDEKERRTRARERERAARSRAERKRAGSDAATA